MIELHAAVDHRDPHVAAGRAAMQLGQTPARRGRLQREQRIVVGAAARNRFIACAHATPGSWLSWPATSSAPARGGHLHHVAVEADDRHRPRGGEGEAVGSCQRRGDPPPRRAAAGVGIAAGVVAVGAEVGRRQVEEHQHLLLRIGAGRRRRRARGSAAPASAAKRDRAQPPGSALSSRRLAFERLDPRDRGRGPQPRERARVRSGRRSS